MSSNRLTDPRLRSAVLAAGVWIFAAAACADPGDREVVTQEEHRPTHVDSIFPPEEELRRFRATLPEEATALSGARSRGELIHRFAEAVQAADTAALTGLALSRAEFAYLYYPHTRFNSPPYELSPALVWFQLQNRSSRGLARLLRRYGARPLSISGHACEEKPETSERNRLWHECTVEFTNGTGEMEIGRLFGSIIERDGRFKFVSYANRL